MTNVQANPDQRLATTSRDAGATASARDGARNAGADEPALVPRVDVLEDDAGITLLADLPGVSKEGLELKVERDTLLIEGAVATQMPAQLQSVYAEVRMPRYRRAFTLSHELDAARIEASLKDGVLNLRIPKLAHAQPRRITIQAG